MSGLTEINQSMPLIADQTRKQRYHSQHRSLKESASKQPLRGPYEKLPLLQISKILRKIGAGDRNKQMFVPNQEDQSSFRKSKWEQLNRQYSPRRYVAKPVFDGELDEVVLDCWKYGQNVGRKTVWRRYRQNCDDLTFDTLRLMKKK